MDEEGMKVFDATYDAWGKQTVSLNTIGLHRGYTGHEMINEFDIINMNGRLYDPVLGRFFRATTFRTPVIVIMSAIIIGKALM